MDQLGSVQQKISCVFETEVLNERSTKRENQSYKVVATDRLKQKAVDSDIYTARATEKLDGTCVYIAKFDGKPWLWARYDRKPTKPAERRFRKFQQQANREGDTAPGKFIWDLEKDFKDTPPFWIPAANVGSVDGALKPDDLGHTPGWVPVSPGARQYCWHLTAIDLGTSQALVLREAADTGYLRLELMGLQDLDGHTAELIGTNINANPYGLGSKKCPLHVLVVHGSLQIRDPPKISSMALKDWFTGAGQVEGIVWHCANKTLFKVHRNHIGLHWPVEDPSLAKRQVEVLVDPASNGEDVSENPVFPKLARLYGQTCASFAALTSLLNEVEDGGYVGQADIGLEKAVSDITKDMNLECAIDCERGVVKT